MMPGGTYICGTAKSTQLKQIIPSRYGNRCRGWLSACGCWAGVEMIRGEDFLAARRLRQMALSSEVASVIDRCHR